MNDLVAKLLAQLEDPEMTEWEEGDPVVVILFALSSAYYEVRGPFEGLPEAMAWAEEKEAVLHAEDPDSVWRSVFKKLWSGDVP